MGGDVGSPPTAPCYEVIRLSGRSAQSSSMRALLRQARRLSGGESWERGPRAVVHVLPNRAAEELPESGAAQSIQEAEVLLAGEELARLWRPRYLESLARSYWRFLARAFLGLIRVVHTPDSPTIVFFSRRLPLLHFRAPEYETEEKRGQVTWPIQRGLLVAKRGRGHGYLRICVERLDREIGAEGAPPLPEPQAAVLVRVEVRNFYPWLRGTGRFARFGTWLYSQSQLRIHVLVCNGFLRSLARLELPRAEGIQEET